MYIATLSRWTRGKKFDDIDNSSIYCRIDVKGDTLKSVMAQINDLRMNSDMMKFTSYQIEDIINEEEQNAG